MIERVRKILKDLEVEAWLLISAENKDPYFKKIINPNTTITSVALITQTSVDVFVHSLDVDNLDKDKYSVIKQKLKKLSLLNRSYETDCYYIYVSSVFSCLR